MFWKKRRKDVQAKAQAVADDAVKTATDLAEKSMVIGPTGVILLLGAAAAGAAATYYIRQRNKRQAAPRSIGQASEATPSPVRPNKKPPR